MGTWLGAVFRLVALNYHTGFQQRALSLRAIPEYVDQVLPSGRGIAKRKIAGNFTDHATRGQVVYGALSPLMLAQLLLIKFARLIEYFKQFGMFGLTAGLGLGLFPRYLQPRIPRQDFNGLWKIHMVKIHDKADCVTTGATAEAIVELPFRLNAE